MASKDLDRNEQHIKVMLGDRLPKVLRDNSGWWADFKPSQGVHDMLFGEERDAGYVGRVEIQIPSGRHGGGIFESLSVFPLHTFVELHLKEGQRGGLLEEMLMWQFLTHYAFFEVSAKTSKGGMTFRVERSWETKPFWSPRDRVVLVKLFQLAGILTVQSLQEFADTYGYQWNPTRVLAYNQSTPKWAHNP